jgi:hypothetical protein
MPGGTSAGAVGFGNFGSLLNSLTDIKATVDQPVPVDVTGQVSLDPASKVDVNVKVSVEGEGRVTGMSASSSGNAQGNVGTSMPHIKAGPR